MDTELTIYVPTRGRPSNAVRLLNQFENTCQSDTRLMFILSADDPRLEEYHNTIASYVVVHPQKRGFVNPLNLGYLQDKTQTRSYAVGFMGDDHLPRTKGWDVTFLHQLRKMKSGFVYGDDGLQGENLPTHIAMTSDIPDYLGFMTLPRLKHLFADNFWLDLGKAIDKIKYLPEIFIEHLHPGAGKAEVDSGYEFSGNHQLHLSDQRLYELYMSSGELHSDAQKVLAMLERTGKL